MDFTNAVARIKRGDQMVVGAEIEEHEHVILLLNTLSWTTKNSIEPIISWIKPRQVLKFRKNHQADVDTGFCLVSQPVTQLQWWPTDPSVFVAVHFDGEMTFYRIRDNKIMQSIRALLNHHPINTDK